MIKCPKCESELPNRYKYCIYCSCKLPNTEENSKQEQLKSKLTLAQYGIAIGALLMLAVVVAVVFILI